MIKNSVICLLALLFTIPNLFAQERTAISSSGGSLSSASYTLQFTAGEPIAGETATSTSYQLSTGFYLPEAGQDLTPPVLNPLGLPLSVAANASLTVEANVTDPGSGVATVSMFYRRGGAPTFTELGMSNTSDDAYSATLDPSTITSRGVEFYFQATDNSGNATRIPAASAEESVLPVLVQIEAPGLESPLPRGQQQSAYRLVSTPLNLSNKSSSNVLSALGSYDDTQWRLWRLKDNYFEFEGEAQYTELRGNANFDPGISFFLITADGGDMQTGEATTLSTTTLFTRTLHRGWNFISNPFDFDVPVSALSLSNGLTPNVQTFTGGWSVQNTLAPFEGYIIDAGMDDDNVVLSIDPDLSAGGKALSAPETNPGKALADITWAIRLDANSGDFFDENNQLGISQVSSMERDALDRPEPPQFGNLSVYFPHENWGPVHRRYQSDFRPSISDGDTWDLEVSSASDVPVRLTFSGLDQVPEQYDVHLVDLEAGVSRDLRTTPAYSLVHRGNAPYRLQLVVGERRYLEDQIDAYGLKPASIELDQNYPNPFNPATTIRFGIQQDATVSLKVYNLLGQVVATLVDQEFKQAGYHVAHWNAMADDGSGLASGVYIYKLEVAAQNADNLSNGPFSLTRKMMLVK